MNTTLLISVILAGMTFLGFLAWFLWRKFTSGSSVPAWAKFFNKQQWLDFNRLVQDYFQTKGYAVTLDVETGIIRTQNNEEIRLINLAQVCFLNEPSEWKELINRHFKTLEEAFLARNETEVLIEDYARVEKILTVHIWPDNFDEAQRKGLVADSTVIPGILPVLAYDFPTTIQNVSPGDIQKWGKSEKEVFDRAYANLLENFPPKITREKIGDGVEVFAFSGDHSFVNSSILLLDHYPQCLGKQGAIIAVPIRYVLLCYPINDANVLQAIQKLIPLTLHLEEKGPRSLTNNLYWYHDHTYELQPYRIQNQTVHFSPTSSFDKMIETFREPVKESQEAKVGEDPTGLEGQQIPLQDAPA